MHRNQIPVPQLRAPRSRLAAGVLAGLAAVWTGCGAGPRLELPDTVRYTVEGRVTASERGLAPASVVLMGTPVGVFTDADGRYRFASVRPGTYRLTVVHQGLRSGPLRLTLPGVADTSATLAMTPDPDLGPPREDLEAVEITASVRGAP